MEFLAGVELHSLVRAAKYVESSCTNYTDAQITLAKVANGPVCSGFFFFYCTLLLERFMFGKCNRPSGPSCDLHQIQSPPYPGFQCTTSPLPSLRTNIEVVGSGDWGPMRRSAFACSSTLPCLCILCIHPNPRWISVNVFVHLIGYKTSPKQQTHKTQMRWYQ